MILIEVIATRRAIRAELGAGEWEAFLPRTLNEAIREASWDTWEDWLLTVYGDQDFTPWDRYHAWLMRELGGKDD